MSYGGGVSKGSVERDLHGIAAAPLANPIPPVTNLNLGNVSIAKNQQNRDMVPLMFAILDRSG
jgi:hypothetical protein